MKGFLASFMFLIAYSAASNIVLAADEAASPDVKHVSWNGAYLGLSIGNGSTKTQLTNTESAPYNKGEFINWQDLAP